MKLITIVEGEQPTVTYKQLGDGSWSARIVAPSGKIYVHTNRDRRVLEKLVKERYMSPNVKWA